MTVSTVLGSLLSRRSYQFSSRRELAGYEILPKHPNGFPDGRPAGVQIWLFQVIVGASVSYSFDLANRYKVGIVATIPKGLPPFTPPPFEVIPAMLSDTFALAIVAFAISVTLAMLFANKHNYSISPNQEFKALGVGNILGSFFQCFPSCASLPRSAVQDSVGGRTQVGG